MIYLQTRIVLLALHGLALHDIWTYCHVAKRLALKQFFIRCWGMLTSHPNELGDLRLSELRLAHMRKFFQCIQYLLLVVLVILLFFYEHRAYADELSADGKITVVFIAVGMVLVRYLLAYPLTEKRLDLIFLLWSLISIMYLSALSWRHFIMSAAFGKLIRTLISVMYMKAHYSALSNFLQVVVVAWRYKSAVNSALGDESEPLVGTWFCIVELMSWICITSICLITQMWFSQFLHHEASLISAKHASERLLSGLCDSLVHLDHDLHIRKATPHLGHLICPTTPIDPNELEGSPFSHYLATESERESFAAFISGRELSKAEHDCARSAATALRARLHHANGNEISVDLFHVQSIDADRKVTHVVGIKEVRNDGVFPDESQFQGNKTSFRHLSDCANDQIENKDQTMKNWCRVAHERSEASKTNMHLPCAASISSSASSASFTKRYLANLRKVQFSIDFLGEEVVVQDYTLEFDRVGGNPIGAPDLASCIRLENMPGFHSWLQEGVNKLLNRDAQQCVYPGEVLFRPPTAACASSKVVLCAESARLRWSNYKVDFPGGEKQQLIQLQLHDIAQVSGQCCKSIGRDSRNELPTLSESKAEPKQTYAEAYEIDPY